MQYSSTYPRWSPVSHATTCVKNCRMSIFQESPPLRHGIHQFRDSRPDHQPILIEWTSSWPSWTCADYHFRTCTPLQKSSGSVGWYTLDYKLLYSPSRVPGDGSGMQLRVTCLVPGSNYSWLGLVFLWLWIWLSHISLLSLNWVNRKERQKDAVLHLVSVGQCCPNCGCTSASGTSRYIRMSLTRMNYSIEPLY